MVESHIQFRFSIEKDALLPSLGIYNKQIPTVTLKFARTMIDQNWLTHLNPTLSALKGKCQRLSVVRKTSFIVTPSAETWMKILIMFYSSQIRPRLDYHLQRPPSNLVSRSSNRIGSLPQLWPNYAESNGYSVHVRRLLLTANFHAFTAQPQKISLSEYLSYNPTTEQHPDFCNTVGYLLDG